MPDESFWNHRVVRRTYPQTGETLLEIHEAHYEAGQSVSDVPARGITVDGVSPCGETIEGLRDTLERMLRALDKPVLDYDDF